MPKIDAKQPRREVVAGGPFGGLSGGGLVMFSFGRTGQPFGLFGLLAMIGSFGPVLLGVPGPRQRGVGVCTSTESLILAQDERWRRA